MQRRLRTGAALRIRSQTPCATLDALDTSGDDGAQIEAARFACRLDLALGEPEARAALGEEQFAFLPDGRTMTLLARGNASQMSVSGSLHGDLARLGASDLFAARYRLAQLDSAMLFIVALADGAPVQPFTPHKWRGPNAPAAPPFEAASRGQDIEREVWSESLGETRRINVHLPLGHDPHGDYAALFIADGAAAGYYARILEPFMQSGEIPPLVIVGAESGQAGIVEDRSNLQLDLRAADYLPGIPNAGERFDQHMHFFAEDLVALAVRDYAVTRDPARRVVQGHSNGAVFSLWAGVMHPEAFGWAIVNSAGYRPLDSLDRAGEGRAHFFMNAGLYEPSFYVSTRASAAFLAAHGYDIAAQDYLPAGHAPDQTEVLLPRYLKQIFAPR